MDNLEMSQYLGLFLEEAKEQVAVLEQSIVELERYPGSDVTLQLLFRSAHSLKGSSRTMGFTQIGDLTHEMETLLDRLRNRTLEISGGVIDALLTSVDVLRCLVEAVEQTGAEPLAEVARIFEAVQKLSLAGTNGPEPVRATTKAAPSGDYQIVEVRLADDSLMKGVRALLVVMAAEDLGKIIECDPPRELLESESFDFTFRIHLHTALTADEIQDALGSMTDVVQVDVIQQEPNVAAELAPRLPVAEQIPEVAAGLALRSPGTELIPEVAAGLALRSSGTEIQPKQDMPEKAATKPEIRPVTSGETVRVSVERLDKLLNLVGELVTDRIRLSALATSLQRRFRQDADAEALVETVARIGRVTGEMQEEVMLTRMLPVDGVFQRMPRMVRDLAKESGKEIEFCISGGETELDRTVLELIADPIIHLLRNAADHGIEPGAVRIAAGKKPNGRIDLRAFQDKGQIVIEVEDDGSGLDPVVLRKAAVRKGLIGQSAADALSDGEAMALIFAPGFSTSESVTSVSGRGVGMDIVRSNVERIGGSVQIDSERNRGTRFILHLPLTLAIVRAVLVRVAGSIYAVPVNSIREIVRLADPGNGVQHCTLGGTRAISLRGATMPLMGLSKVLSGSSGQEEQNSGHALIVSHGDMSTAISVDSLHGEQEVVIKPLGPLVEEIPGVVGASILGDGSVALIVEPARALAAARRRAA